MAAEATRLFANYTQIPARMPGGVWTALRLLTLAATLALVAGLFVSPLGLAVFWGLAIPILPALFVVAPGLWRQVCPMALTNQLPILAGYPSSRTLPEGVRNWAFTVAVGAFVVFVGLRAPLLNRNGAVVGAGILGALFLALLGGIAFKGRSGWCGTFCPLAPIQRDYGHAPLVMVRNGYCRPCVGCQKNCYDFNPRAAVFEDLSDSDPVYAGQRRFFMAMMPGTVLGYFLQPVQPSYGQGVRALVFLGAICLSVGLYQAVVSFFRLNPFRAGNLFAGLALAGFYWFAGPEILTTIEGILDVNVPSALVAASRASGVLLALGVGYCGWRNERVLRAANAETTQVRVAPTGRSLRDRLAASTAALVTDAETGTAFPVAPNQTLLDALEAAQMKIEFGCRSGLCGADAVIVQSGQENLSPAEETERATLRRLGLDGVGRLACMCRVSGNVAIDRDIKNARRSFAAAASLPSAADPLRDKGISRVVIVGNGVAGITVADYLRNESKSVQITIVTDESHHFYNRMAVGRLLYGRSAMDGLILVPEDWYGEKDIKVWRNTLAVSIDRARRTVRLGTGEEVSYDILVLATGADALAPSPDYSDFSNAFVLRSAEDALAVRMWAQRNAARRAVVIGGGVLGIEAAEALDLLGLRVTLLHRGARLMDRQLDEQGAVRLGQYLGNIGVDVRTQAVVAELEGGEALETIVLADGRRIAGDIFLACVGVRPRVQLARLCGLEVARGIVVDRFMRSSDPAIYAVGDAAELPGAVGGFWPVATSQAGACVASIIGRDHGYDIPRPVIQLKCEGIDLKSFGDMEVREGDEVISAAEDAPAWWRVVLRDGALESAVFVGPAGSGRDFGRLVQPGVDIRTLLGELQTAIAGTGRDRLVGLA